LPQLGAKFNPVRASFDVVTISSFNSEKKRMGVIVKVSYLQIDAFQGNHFDLAEAAMIVPDLSIDPSGSL
jgi:magnesium-transporting ATPase (P-type)